MTLTLNQAVLAAALNKVLERHADAGGAYLVEALSHPGQGAHHEGNPNPSSLVGDYPAVQTEALMQSILVEQDGPLSFQIGSFESANAEGYSHAQELETRPPQQGGRPFLEKAWADDEFRAALLRGDANG